MYPLFTLYTTFKPKIYRYIMIKKTISSNKIDIVLGGYLYIGISGRYTAVIHR